MRGKGVVMRFGQMVTGFLGDADGRVRKVSIGSEEIETDLVVLAIGRKPNTELAKAAGLEIGKRGGIAVNDRLQTGDPDIYAGGDCVESTHRVTGGKVLIPLGSTANKHGRVIGANITGGSESFPGIVGSAVARVFSCNVGRTGLSESQAKDAGYDYVTVLVPGTERASYYPGAKEILVKLVAEKAGGRLLGGQVVGSGDVAKRLDILAVAITSGAKADDLASSDLCYAPPFNSAMDPLHHAANVIRNKLAGDARSISPVELKKKLDAGEDFILLDVRSPLEWNTVRIDVPQARLIPLPELRRRLAELPRDKEIVTLCRASVRAYQAQKILDGAGFRDVKFVDGSISFWPYELKSDR
jgi:rhodanese-related sulfurtransferase